MKTLSVVIPYYKEKEKDVLPLLSSLNNQLGADYSKIEVILVNDGNKNVFSDQFLKLFHNLDLRVIYMKKNKGPGIARQTGLDSASGEYVMFCDADDIIHNVGILGLFMQEIEEQRPDVLVSPWIEEMYDEVNGRFVYINHENENTWMHGKAFRRVFLQAKDIRFHETLRVHEDSYFLSLVMAHTQNVRKILTVSYVWKWGADSITRRDGGIYSFDSIPEFVRAIVLSLEKIEKAAPEQMPYKVIQLIIYHYFSIQEPRWQAPENAVHLKNTEAALRELIAPYMHYFENSPIEEINRIYLAEQAKHSQGPVSELFGVWLNRVMNSEENEQPALKE